MKNSNDTNTKDESDLSLMRTKGEWKINKSFPKFFTMGNALIETDKQVVCRLMENDYDDPKEAKANAEYICNAVNCHEILVDAVKSGAKEFADVAEKCLTLKKQKDDLVAALQGVLNNVNGNGDVILRQHGKVLAEIHSALNKINS